MGRTKKPCAVMWLGLVSCVLGYGQASGQALGLRERPLCPPEAGDQCRQGDFTVDEYFYAVNGHQHRLNFASGDYFKATCEAAALDDPALPRFPHPKRFRRVTLSGCAPPVNSSYAEALRLLNVTVVDRLSLLRLPAGTRLSAATLAGLPQLDSLELDAAPGAGALLPEAGFLSAFNELRSLVLNGVRPDRLPPRLDGLRLRHTGIETLPPEALGVITLEVIEENLTSVSGIAPRLKTLTLSAPVAAPPAAPALENAALTHWAQATPGPWTDCGKLKALYITQAAATELPEGFVSACASLETLELQLLVAPLPRGFLRGAARLRTFKAANCALDGLPPDLFDYSPNVQEIDLSHNNLSSLPRDVFSGLVGPLEILTLSHNRLTALDIDVAVSPLTSLLELKLDSNPLGNLCTESNQNFDTGTVSVLSGLRSLRVLVLSRCSLTRVCADWSRDMQALRRLDLTRNAIARLACRDLTPRRALPAADVDLRRNPLLAVDCAERDLLQARETAVPAQEAKIVIDSGLHCDCGAYWLARMLRERSVAVQFDPRCATTNRTHEGKSISNMPLRSVPLDALSCPLPAKHCAPNCTCVYAHANGARAGGVRARCGAGAALPQALLAAREPLLLRQLSVRGGLRELRPVILPATLQELDLHNNSLRNMSAAAAAALFADARRVRLTGNPLQCDCGNAPLIDAIKANRHLVIAYENMTCSDLQSFDSAVRALDCSATRGLALGALAALALGALAAVALAALLARPETRLRVKVLLHARGYWLARRFEPADSDRPFDAFIAHSDTDALLVHTSLLPRLAPRRLCLAARDWPAGAWIPKQIDASVRGSRSTVAVVSREGLKEGWTLAAMRAAHAASLNDRQPRLLLLLLDVTSRELRRSPELRALAASTRTLRWGEPGFWDKLQYALPAPRPDHKLALSGAA